MAENFTIIQSISLQEETLDIPIEDDNEHTPYTFDINPLFFIPSSSSSSCSFHNHNNQVNFNSCSSCSSESDNELCPDSSLVYPHSFHNYNDHQYDQMDFITDLFDTRRDVTTRYSVNNNDNTNDDENENDDDIVSSGVDDLGLGLSGLRVVGIESDSDTEELGHVDERHDDGNDESVGRTELISLEHFWDCPLFDTEERNQEEGLSSVIERIEEISVSSEMTSEGDATVGALEWEILLAVNNLERDIEIETDGAGEGFVYTPEFDTLIGQFVETVRALRGSPPAAKSIVDNLPLVAMKRDGNEDDQVVCAVCKDEILVEEKVMELPCRHLYHGECIVPWLSIRNTCPVCRFELPTDDVDYERSKNRVNGDETGFEIFA
uniref:RING-type E3 ubiquitin transferase n=1 Tax=Tanacetum cinerariifolium TaxID=118510 RepID=A0A699GRE3_TANCI|nr:hypothetical protein [Tanacetum cinerariifolium]